MRSVDDGDGGREITAADTWAWIKGEGGGEDEGNSRLSTEFDLASEVDKGRVLWINYRNYLISLPRSPRSGL